MRSSLFLSFLMALCTVSCFNDDDDSDSDGNKVLLLKVDFLENTFEGGQEFRFSDAGSTFTINNEYDPPGDFGNIKLIYRELDETLFDGTIIWSGLGEMKFPKTLNTAGDFKHVMTDDWMAPSAGFENVFNPANETYDYNKIWNPVQSLVKVREYLSSNPNGSVKLFLYTPSVGIGNPADWDWIIFVKN